MDEAEVVVSRGGRSVSASRVRVASRRAARHGPPRARAASVRGAEEEETLGDLGVRALGEAPRAVRDAHAGDVLLQRAPRRRRRRGRVNGRRRASVSFEGLRRRASARSPALLAASVRVEDVHPGARGLAYGHAEGAERRDEGGAGGARLSVGGGGGGGNEIRVFVRFDASRESGVGAVGTRVAPRIETSRSGRSCGSKRSCRSRSPHHIVAPVLSGAPRLCRGLWRN